MKPLFITEAEARRLLPDKKAFELAAKAFRLSAQGKTRMPPKLYLELPGQNDFRAMPAFALDGRHRICGVKWVSVFPRNPKVGLPTVNASILLNSANTGQTLALVEASTLTALRTAAASAVATRLLARLDSRTLGIVGAGLQAGYQLSALASLYPFREIRAWGLHFEETAAWAKRQRAASGVRLRAVRTIRECVEGSDILVTCTPSRKPIVQLSWVGEGTHINAIGADAPGKEELDPLILKRAKVVVDEWSQASHSGEINVPLAKGLLSKRSVYAELREIVSGKKRGRVSRSEITVFDSTGLAILDVLFASYLYDKVKVGRRR